MADDTNFRSYRSSAPYGRGEAAPAPSTRGASDPLAELARLIGQNDPFADLRRDGSHGEAPGAAHQGAPADPGGTDWQQSGHANPAGAPYRDAYGAQQAPQQFGQQPFENQSYADPRDGGEGFQPAYDPAVYGNAQHDDRGYGAETYYEGPAHAPQGEEGYDDIPESPRRGGLKTVMALIALVILGAGGAFAYRSMFGPGGTTVPPPVIKADTTPNKVVPAQSGEPSNKLIHDRVGEASQGEKVVSREEQPVEIKDSSRPATPRVVFPTPGKPDAAVAATPSPPLGAAPALGPASAEPKKVRTVTIRPDQPMSLDPGAAKTNPALPRSANAMTATPTPTGGAGFPPANSRPAAAKPAPAAASPAAVQPPAGNAPLSLSPQGSNAAPAAPARIASASSGSAAGAYTVQLSSQRSEAEAQASFRSLQSKYPNLLNDRQPIIRRADLGEKGIYFRAMVGPFASVEEASGFCGSLKSAGGQCVVQRN